MSQIHFDGPVDISPELAMALWNAMPETGQSGVAQLFFSRFVTAPISDAALKAGAQVFFEREKIGKAAAEALRKGVYERCRKLGEERVNEQVLSGIVSDEMRKAATDFCKEHVGKAIEAIPVELLAEAAKPAVETMVRQLAQKYFTTTHEGQNWILGLIETVKQEHESELKETMRDRMFDGADRVVPRKPRLTKAESVA